jgi:hypothetical protein
LADYPGVARRALVAEVAMRDESLTLTVADVSVRLDVTGLPARRRLELYARYGEFLRPSPAGPACIAALAVQEVTGADFLPWAEHAGLPVRVRLQGDRLWVRTPWESGWLDLVSGAGAVTLRPRGNCENFLRAVYAWLCLQRGGLLLHACGLAAAGRGYLFAGPSGAGKSTVAALAAEAAVGAAVLSDDLVIVRPVQGHYQLYGTPFHGSASTAPRCTGSARLAGIYFLVQAPAHALAPVGGAAAVAQMATATPFVTTLPAGAALTLAVCARLAAQVAPQALHFRPDPGFWEVIHA